jgi:ATP-binding cassette subfamily F protein 3
MVERVADRLWLVKDGAVQDFHGDLDDYREFILQSRREDKKADRKKDAPAPVEAAPAAPKMSKSTATRKAADAEKAIQKLTTEKEKLEALMASPGFYDNPEKVRETKGNYDRIVADLETQEMLWLEAQDARDRAEG